MKTHIIPRLSAVLCALGLALALLPSAMAAEPAAAGGSSRSDRGITLFETPEGNYDLVAVEGYLLQHPDGTEEDQRTLTVRTYSPDFHLLDRQELDIELPEIGGVFSGEDCNFLVFGQENPEESAGKEVLRVVKYSKDWQRLDDVRISGINSVDIVGAHGNLSFAERSGILYIHTAHAMFRGNDGVNHQANLSLSIRESDMTVTGKADAVSNPSTGYVSHSFAQDVIVDSQGRLVTLDNGDGYPRGAYLYRYNGSSFSDGGDGFLLAEWSGAVGENQVGANTTALVETSQGYLSAWIDSGRGAAHRPSDPYNAYLAFTPKDAFTEAATTTRQLTAFGAGAAESAGYVYLVPTGPEGGYVLWYTAAKNGSYYNGEYRLFCASYGADGSLGAVRELGVVPMPYNGPIFTDGRLLWASSSENPDSLQFCTLDENGLEIFQAGGGDGEDAAGSDPAVDIPDAPSVTPPDTPSDPADPSTGGSPAGEASGQEASGTAPLFRDVLPDHWAYSAIRSAVDSGIVNGYGDGTFRPAATVTNAHFNAMMARAFFPGEAEDASGRWWSAYVSLNQERGLLEGTSLQAARTAQGTYDGCINQAISRYDMAQMLYNLLLEQGAELPDEAAMQAVQGRMDDWAQIPAGYREAVAACYALGVLNGQSNGCFGGDNPMNRAQGCTVIARLLNQIRG